MLIEEGVLDLFPCRLFKEPQMTNTLEKSRSYVRHQMYISNRYRVERKSLESLNNCKPPIPAGERLLVVHLLAAPSSLSGPAAVPAWVIFHKAFFHVHLSYHPQSPLVLLMARWDTGQVDRKPWERSERRAPPLSAWR